MASQLTKALQLRCGQVRVTKQVMHGILQHRAVARRQHEAIAIAPGRVVRVDVDEPVEQNGRYVRHPHRHAGVARIRFLDGIHREDADRIRHRGLDRPDSGHRLDRFELVHRNFFPKRRAACAP